jgi:hypothetical protein
LSVVDESLKDYIIQILCLQKRFRVIAVCGSASNNNGAILENRNRFAGNAATGSINLDAKQKAYLKNSRCNDCEINVIFSN